MSRYLQLGPLLGIVAALAAASGCGPAKAPDASVSGPVPVAAAANLTEAFGELGKRFTAKTGIAVVFSYGSTAQLARQPEDGPPFDIFAAADNEHVDALAKKGILLAEPCAVYARGRLALWIPKGETLGVRDLSGLVKPSIRVIAIATPAAAPYGQAAVEALKSSGLWQQVETKIVYANNISMAKQFAATANADAAFTAYSLILHEQGIVLRVDEQLHKKIHQSLGILKASPRIQSAKRFT